MIHFVDAEAEFDQIMGGEFIEYMRELKRRGAVRHIGMSTHNPARGPQGGPVRQQIEMLLFSVTRPLSCCRAART